MARSKYIYLIKYKSNPAILLAAFTVKYEASEWLLHSDYNENTAQLSRISDGLYNRKEEKIIPWS